jgi:copper oxidase (laccase) domain-containing protein
VGRRGLVNGVALNAIQKMRELGADSISAQLGPSICGTCYEVDQKTFDEVLLSHPMARSRSLQGNLALDLTKALVQELTKLSIHCTIDTRCTKEDENLFSYRKSQRTGRQVGLIRL